MYIPDCVEGLVDVGITALGGLTGVDVGMGGPAGVDVGIGGPACVGVGMGGVVGVDATATGVLLIGMTTAEEVLGPAVMGNVMLNYCSRGQ